MPPANDHPWRGRNSTIVEKRREAGEAFKSYQEKRTELY